MSLDKKGYVANEQDRRVFCRHVSIIRSPRFNGMKLNRTEAQVGSHGAKLRESNRSRVGHEAALEDVAGKCSCGSSIQHWLCIWEQKA